jgi:hypothetical protein
MLTTKQFGEDHITVIPFCPHCACQFRNPIIVYKLCFWLNNKLDHVVTKESVSQFILQAKLYGATIYPDYPELGCYAINTDEQFSPAGKTRVSEIHYRDKVIYSGSKQAH